MAGGTPRSDHRLGLWPALAVVAGSMLGVGIFISPPEVAADISGPGYFLLIWALGGFAALCGALSVAELGAMLPQAGGDYPYLRLAYGPGVAFSAGWLQLLATFPGSLAAMAVGVATYQLPVLAGEGFAEAIHLGPLTMEAPTFWAAVIVIALTAVNHVGVLVSGRAQIILTSAPLVVLLLASVLLVGGVGVGQIAEWNAAIYIGGEIRNPGKNLPRAVIGGTSLVVLLYLVLCGGYLSLFPPSELAAVGEAGTAAARQIFGAAGVIGVTTLILLAMLGSINGTVLTGSRIAFAMAEGGDCVESAARLHPRFGTPVVALWGQAGLALLLIATQTFAQLMDYASCAMLITGTLTVLSVIVLRRRLPKLERPYKLHLFPVAPVLYAISSFVVVVVLLMDLDPSVFLSIGWFALALLFHAVVLRRRKVPTDQEIMAAASAPGPEPSGGREP